MQAEGRAPLSGDPALPTEPQPARDADPGVAATPPTAAAVARRRHRRLGLLLAVAVLVVALDQVTKLLVVARLADREPVRLLGGLVTLTYTRNAGAAFSLGTGFTLIFTVLAGGSASICA